MVCTVIHLIEMSSKRRQNMLLTSVPYKIIKETRTTATMVNAYYSSMNGIWKTYLCMV